MKKKAKLSPREIVMVVFLAIMLVGVVYYLAFLTPLNKEMDNIDKEIVNLQTKIDEAQQNKLVQLVAMEKELEELRALPPEALTEVPSTDNLSEVLLNLYDYLDSNTIEYEINLLEPEIGEDMTVRRFVKINFKTASYDSGRAIIDELTSNKWRCLITSTSLVEDETNDIMGGSNLIEGQLNLTFFELSEPAS